MDKTSPDQMNEYIQRYRIYVKDSLDDKNFEITSLEDFDDWLEEEKYNQAL